MPCLYLYDVFRADFSTQAVSQAGLQIHQMQLLRHLAPLFLGQENLAAGKLYFSMIVFFSSSASDFM